MDDNIEKGIITRIYLENFVTYDSAIVNPARYLNVIVGPNGSGKSTIVAAIVLGLGGKPNIIGRALHIGEYVKYGCQSAKIEIHLKNGNKQDHVIVRTFTKEGTSKWMINGALSSAKAVQEFTSSLNIQVDNLCQFLPQDKVQDFSKMDAQALLENTERSVGDPKLLEYHQTLKKIRTDSKELELDVANKKRLLESKVQRRDGLQQTVSTIKERKLIKKKITTLKQKKAWMLYEEMRRKLVESKKIRDTAAKEMQSIDAKLIPIKKKLEKIQYDIATLKKSLNDHNNKVNAKNMKLKSVINEILSCENRIKESENTCSRRIQTEENRDQDIKLAQQQKSKLENDFSLMINEIGTEESLIKQLQNIASNMEEHRRIMDNFTNKKNILKHEEENIGHEIRAVQAEHQSLNIDVKRLELLKRVSPDAYKGVLWLKENRDKFSATVYEPMLLSINVKEASYAKYLENIIPFRDLVAFTCENKQDMNLLLRYLRDQQKLQVNAVYSDNTKKIMPPNIPLQDIKQFGFKHYLVSLIEAPPVIMTYLVSMYQLNNIPVGNNEVENNTDRIPRSLSCYFSENNIYSVNISRYTRTTSTRISQVNGNGMLSIVLDKSKLQRLQERLTNLQEKKNQILIDIKQEEDKICEETKEIEKYRTDRNKYQQNIQHIQALKSRIRIAANKIEQLEMDRTSIDNIKSACTKEIKAIIKKQLQMYKEYNTILKECFNCVTSNDEVKFAIALLHQTLVVKENEAADFKDMFTNAERIFKQHDEEFQPLKREAERLYNEALTSTNNINPQDNMFKSLNKAFEKLPATISEINKELHIAQAKVFCMAKNVDAENVLHEYEEIQNNIQNLTEFIKKKTTKLEEMTKEIKRLKDKWLPLLEQLIERINTNFSSYFSAMDCAGEVTLAHGEDILDFDQYGLKIRVKFRDADELQELTRHFQSGGERTVTTAIYMIALQELSRVPFRCVDEINQGMDAVNENRVFNLLVKMTGRPGSSQYFLLTPKLLLDLSYAETVTVHCVLNGPVINTDDKEFEFDTEAYINSFASTTNP
ncbi:structural maintenance of chromosomes protein 5 [Cataglyphis hispanica]|uniref:structural maintenance of chromosomes protein 5 n=1 Tax=Cataglyphis hispanica TaxID=1086592 RepID=UPI00217F43A8|nr:structural maintenance of chromosomes protein 5 [Cataglyphis hispanica]XP_050458300.1 structural maintenance of chromosomes protein 5 [Cataglyphis hispanica]XP_050458301.1 structural maintenance of chromosomes protein 5 [Cataglyphis hispanica]